MQVYIPKEVTVVELESAPFKNVKEAMSWVRSHGVVGLMSDVDTKGKGEISISVRSIDKMLSGSALDKSVTPAIHLAAMARIRDIIRESFVAEIHPDYLKVKGLRSTGNPTNSQVSVAVLYGSVSLADIPYRAKTTLKLHLDVNHPTKAYSYEISNIEVLAGTAESLIQPNTKTSMNANILLNGVTDVNGQPMIA